MATEQEELRLSVTLVDNASAGLEKLGAHIKELGGGNQGGGNKHVQKLDEQTKALTETIIKMTGSFGEAFKSLGMLRLGFVGGVAGLAAFGYEMAKQMKDLGEYTEKLRGLAQLGKDIGVAPSSIKNIADQLKVFGVAAEVSEAALSKFAQRMAELQRDPLVGRGILKQTKDTPEAQADMRARIDALNKANTLEEKLNIILQLRENIRKNAKDRGESDERAADEANRITGQLFSYDSVLSRAGELKRRSAEEKALDDQRFAAATRYATILGEIEKKWDDIKAIMYDTQMGENSNFMLGLKAANAALEGIISSLNYLRGPAAPLSPEQQLQRDDFQKRQLQDENRRRELMGLPPRSELEQKKSTDENTAAIKKLTSFFDGFGAGVGGGGAGSGGGIINANYTTGGGDGGGGGARAPYGSSVGPGTGPGAGSDGGSGARMTQNKREVAQAAVAALRKSGMSENAIAGIMANVADESDFDPNNRHADQPGYSGEAHYAHGLYQEGGAEWNNYSSWLSKEHPGGNWRDPALQSEFLAQNLQKNYSGLWKQMQGAKTPGEAASAFVNKYLKPSQRFRRGRSEKYLRGVPGVDAYTGGDQPNGQTAGPGTGAGAGASPVHAASRMAPGHGPFKGGSPDELVVHYTGGIQHFTGEQYARAITGGDPYMTKYHAQLFMDEHGNVTRVVPEGQTSWHAGPANPTGEGMEIATKYGGENPNLKGSGINAEQRAALRKFYENARRGGQYPGGVRGHSEVTPGHRVNEGAFEAQELRRQIDQQQSMTHKVDGSGKITVDVNAPKNTSVGAEGKGLFTSVEINRQTQMSKAARGPSGHYATEALL